MLGSWDSWWFIVRKNRSGVSLVREKRKAETERQERDNKTSRHLALGPVSDNVWLWGEGKLYEDIKIGMYQKTTHSENQFRENNTVPDLGLDWTQASSFNVLGAKEMQIYKWLSTQHRNEPMNFNAVQRLHCYFKPPNAPILLSLEHRANYSQN